MALIEYNPPLEPYLDIIYQDNHLCVVNKPSGLLSVPGNQPQYYDSAMSRVKEKFGFFVSLRIVWIWQRAVLLCLL